MLTYATANVEDGARLDVSVTGFWGGRHQKVFLMLRSSIQMLQGIVDHRFLLYTESLRRIKDISMSREFVKLKWLPLHP